MMLFGLHKFSGTVIVNMDDTCRDLFSRSWQFLFDQTVSLAETLSADGEQFFHQTMIYLLGEDSMIKASGELRLVEQMSTQWSIDRWQSWVEELRSNGFSRTDMEPQVDLILQYLLDHGM